MDDDDRGVAPGAWHGPSAGPHEGPTAGERGSAGGHDAGELGTYIRGQREAARLSLRRLARIAGVSNPYLSQIERGLRRPSAEILQAIARGLGISSEILYVKAGILDQREPEEDLERVIARDPRLTDAQRQTLLEMYRTFRATPRRDAGRRGGLFDAVTTGDVDDTDVRAASLPDEDDTV